MQEIIFGLSKYFDGDYYAGNGPQLITKVVKDVCEGKYENCDYCVATCLNLTIYDNWVFYPISYFNWEKLYESTTTFDFSLLYKSSYSVHLWNKLSFPIERAPKSSPIRKLAEENCPNVNDIMLNFCQTNPPSCLTISRGTLLCESLLNCRLMWQKHSKFVYLFLPEILILQNVYNSLNRNICLYIYYLLIITNHYNSEYLMPVYN